MQAKDSCPRIAALQVQFEEREDSKACTIAINDDDVFEGAESFSVELSMPAYALLGNVTRATVTITDPEDEPTLQFDRSTFRVSESAGSLSAPVQRKGGAGWAEPCGGEPSWQGGSPWALPAYSFGKGSVAHLQWQAAHRAVFFIFLTFPFSDVKASGVWICCNSWHEQEKTLLFVCWLSMI